jgi:hypothetical protein
MTPAVTSERADVVGNQPQPRREPSGWLDEADGWIRAQVARRGQFLRPLPRQIVALSRSTAATG